MSQRNQLMKAADNAVLSMETREYAPGAKPMKRRMHELFCRYRSRAFGKADSYRSACQHSYQGRRTTYTEKNAYQMACLLEQKREIAERIQYLTKDEVEAIREKRSRLEERLWNIHDADIGDCFETTETGEKPKRLSDMSPELRKNIEKIVIDSKGRIIPQLYSAPAANKELRAMLNIGKSSDAGAVSSLSDAELVAQLSDQAKQLGVDINLSYDFVKPVSASPSLPGDEQLDTEHNDIKDIES
jgi:hypothetical protein